MANQVDLDKSSDRVAEGEAAGDKYVTDMEGIRDNLASDDGSTLGNMVSNQLKLTEAETEYQVRAGIPNKASKAVKKAAGEVKSNQ